MSAALTAGERVRRGAAWLDRKRPGWFEHINIARLDVGSGSDCVIAQLNGDSFLTGLIRMDAEDIDVRSLGFMGETVTDDRELNHAWRTLILRRLHGERPPLRTRLGYGITRLVRRMFFLSAA